MNYILSIFLLFIVTIFTSLSTSSAQAAEKIVIEYGAYSSEGKTIAEWRKYGNRQQRRSINVGLDLEANLNFIRFERFLRSEGGQCILNQLGKGIKPSPGSTKGALAVSSTLIKAAKDGNLNSLEILKGYPFPKVYVDGLLLLRASNHILETQNEILESLRQAGFPVEQAQMLYTEALFGTNEKIDKDLKRFNLNKLDYDILEKIALSICKKLDSKTITK